MRRMQIHDCYDPARQEERRQADWDKYTENLPVCAICGRLVHYAEKYHTAHGENVCCECLEELTENTKTVEF